MEHSISDEARSLRTLLDSVSIKAIVCDRKTHELLYANQGALDFSDRNGEPYAGHTCYEYLMHRNTPCDDCRICHLSHDALPYDEVYRGDKCYRRRGQRISWDGRDAFVEYVEDITAEKESMLLDKQDSERMHEVLSQVRVGIIEYEYRNGDITIVGANKAAYDLIGINERLVLGKKNEEILALTHPDDCQIVWNILKQLCTGDCDAEAVFRDKHKITGEYLWLKVLGRSKTQPDGSVRFFATYTDITRQQMLSEKLRHNEIALNAAINNSNMFYWEVDLATNTAIFGKRIREYYSLPETEADFLNSWIDRGLIYPDDVEEYRRKTTELLHAERAQSEWDYRFYDVKSNCYIWGHLCYNLIFDSKGKPIKAVALLHNIHDAKTIENNFVRAETQNGIWTWELDLEAKRLSKVGNDAVDRMWPMGDVIENVPESIIQAGVYAEESYPLVRDAFDRAFKGENNIRFQAKRWSPEKQSFCWHEMIITVIDDGLAPVRKALFTSRDISAEKTLESRFRNEVKFRANMSKDIIAECSVDLTRREVIDIWCNGVNMMSEERKCLVDFRSRIGLFLDDIRLSDEENAELSPDRLLEQHENGIRTTEKLFFAKNRKTGRACWIYTEVKLFSNPSTGSVVAFFYNHDSTIRVLSEMLAKGISSKAYDLVGYIAVQDEVFYLEDYDWSSPDSATKYAEYDRFINEVICKRVPESERETFMQAHLLQTVIACLKDSPVYSSQHRYINADGSISVKLVKFSYSDDDREFIVVTRTDITELLADEERKKQQLESALQEANRANRAKSDFLATMSHDMRTPLNAIMGLASLTLDEAGNEEAVRKNMTQIRLSSDFLLGLINDILDMAKIEQGTIKFQLEPYHYTDFLSTIKTMFAPQCEQRGIRFEFEEVTTALTVLADKTRINQVFFNVFSNAVKYTPEGGCVSYHSENFRIEGNRTSADYIVSDTGIGMSREFLSKVFQPFVQENTSVTAHLQGTGLGLAITKNLVDAMGGTIQIESEQGKGTTVRIHLSFEICPDQDKQAKKETNEEASYHSLNGKKILLVEDNPVNQMIAQKVLEKEQIYVITAENGQIAVQKFQAAAEGYFDAVLMDIRMPVMNGLEATKAIRMLHRTDAKEIPIIAMSANAYEEDKAIAYEAGMTDYLAKPVNAKQLYETLCKRLAESRS